MAANKLNIDEAREKITKIGGITQNLSDALIVIRSFSNETYQDTSAAFVKDISDTVDELEKIAKTLLEGHAALVRAFDKYAEEHSSIAARL